jgi:hypothetical protein
MLLIYILKVLFSIIHGAKIGYLGYPTKSFG